MNRSEYEDGIRELYNGIGKAKMSPYKDPRFQGYMKQIEDLGFDMTRPAIRNMATTMFIVIDMEERENEHIYKDVLLVFETIRSEGKTSSAKCFSVLRRYIDDLITELREETLAEYVYPITEYSDLIDELEKYEDEHPGEISDKEITRILSTKGTTRNVRKSGEEREKRDKEASAKGELSVYKLKKEINLDEYMEKLRENGWDTEKDRGLIEFVYKNDYEALSTSDNEDTVKSRIKGIREFEENGSAGPVAKMKLVENIEDVFTGTQFEEEYKGLADLYKLRAFREEPDYYEGEKSQFRTRVVLTRGWQDVDTLKDTEKFFDFLFDSQLSGDKMAFVPSVVQVCKELEKTEIKKEKRVYDEDDPSEYEIQEVVDTEIVKSVIEKIRAAILEIPENELTLPQIEVILTIIEDFGESGKNDSKQHFLELKEAVKSGKVISTTEKSADKKAEQEAAEKARKEEEERKKAEEERVRREEEEAKIRFEEEKKAEEAKKAEEEKKRREEEDKKAEEDKLRQKRREERKKRIYPKSYQNQKEYEDGVKDLLERFADIDTDFMDKDGLEDYLEEAQKAGLDVNNPGIRNIIIILNDSDNAVLKENKNIKRNDLRNSEIEGLFNHFGTNMMSLSSKKRYKGRRDTKYDKFLEEYKEAEPLMTVIAKFENRLHLGASKKALDSLKLKAGEISDIKDTDKDNLTEYEKKARSILEGLSKERRKELAGKKYTDDITYDDFMQKAFLNGWELEKDLPFLELVFEKFTKLPKKTDGDKYIGVTSTVVSIFNSKAKTYRFKARVAVHAGNTTGMRDTFDDFANYYRREAVNDYLTRDDESVYKEAARAGWKEESDKEFIDALKIQYNKDIRNRKGESAIPDPNQKKQRGIPQKYDNDMQKLVKFFFGVFKTPKEKLDYLKAINWAKNNLVTEHRALAIYDKTVARYEEIVNSGLNSGNVIHDGQEDINAQKEADKKHIEEENRRREEEKARKEKEEAERRKAEEDAKKAEEERVRREEEERKRLEEENKRREEERVRKEREEADKRKAEEERKRIEEEKDNNQENNKFTFEDLLGYMQEAGWSKDDEKFATMLYKKLEGIRARATSGEKIDLDNYNNYRDYLNNLLDNDVKNFSDKYKWAKKYKSDYIYVNENPDEIDAVLNRYEAKAEYENKEKNRKSFIVTVNVKGWAKVGNYENILSKLFDAKFTKDGLFNPGINSLCKELEKNNVISWDRNSKVVVKEEMIASYLKKMEEVILSVPKDERTKEQELFAEAINNTLHPKAVADDDNVNENKINVITEEKKHIDIKDAEKAFANYKKGAMTKAQYEAALDVLKVRLENFDTKLIKENGLKDFLKQAEKNGLNISDNAIRSAVTIGHSFAVMAPEVDDAFEDGYATPDIKNENSFLTFGDAHKIQQILNASKSFVLEDMPNWDYGRHQEYSDWMESFIAGIKIGKVTISLDELVQYEKDNIEPRLEKNLKKLKKEKELEEKRRIEEEKKREIEEAKRREEEAKRKQEEEKRKAEEELRRKQEREKRRAEEERRKAEKEKRKAEEERRKAEEDAKKPKEVKDMESKKFYVGITYDDFLKKAELNGWDLKKEGKFLKNVFDDYERQKVKVNGDEHLKMTRIVSNIYDNRVRKPHYKVVMAKNAAFYNQKYLIDQAIFTDRILDDFLLGDEEHFLEIAVDKGWTDERDMEFLYELKRTYKLMSDRKIRDDFIETEDRNGILLYISKDVRVYTNAIYELLRGEDKSNYEKSEALNKVYRYFEKSGNTALIKSLALEYKDLSEGKTDSENIREGEERRRLARQERERKKAEEEAKRKQALEEKERIEREEAERLRLEKERIQREKEEAERKEQERIKREKEEAERKKAEEERKKAEEERKRIAEEERKRFEDEKFRNTPSMRLIPGKEKKETKAEIKSDKDFDEAVTELYDRINNYMEFNIPKVEGQDEFIKEVEKAGFDTSIPAVKKLLLVFHAKTVVTDKKGVADNILKKIKDTKKGSYFKSLSAILSKLDEVSRNFDPILHDTGAINAAKSIQGLLKNIEKYEPGLKDYDEKVIREGKITAPKELSQKEEEQPKAEERIQKAEEKIQKEKESAQPQKKENPIKQKQPEGMQEKDYFEDEDEENNINNINNINTSTKKTTADKNKKNDDDIPADKKKAIEYAKKYDQFMAVKQSMLEGLKSFKEGIINNAQKDKKLYRNLATMSDEQKTEAFLKDGSVYYRRMAKALEDCIKLLESGECHEGKIYKQFFELENRAIQYQEYNKPLLSPASHEYKTGSGKIRYRIAENFEKCAGMWRMEYSYLNRELLTLSGGGKKYATDEAKGRYAAELKDKYQLETEDMTEEQLKEYSKVSSLRSQFVNKVANDGFKEIIRFYAHYSHNRSADEYLTVVGAPDSIDKKAAWFVFKQEIDKIFAEDVTADEISKIIKSYSPERLKAKISRLKKDKVFKEVCTKNETGAFSKWEDIDLDSRKAAYAIKKTISTKTERLSGCFPLDAHLVNDVRETAATIIAESIMSKPENAEIIHRAYAAENGKQEVLNDIQQLKFIASGYLRRKDLIKTDGSVTIANVAEKILYNDSIQKAILKEYHSKKKAAKSKKNIADIRLDGSQNEKNPVNMINDININTNMAPTFDLNKEKNNIIE